MKALSKKKEEASFWTAIFFCPCELPTLTVAEFTLQTPSNDSEIEVVARKTTAERLAKARVKELNAEMLHPHKWSFKLIELKGGGRR